MLDCIFGMIFSILKHEVMPDGSVFEFVDFDEDVFQKLNEVGKLIFLFKGLQIDDGYRFVEGVGEERGY
jgi:hypothetical protein